MPNEQRRGRRRAPERLSREIQARLRLVQGARTQSEFAAACDLPTDTVNGWFRWGRVPDLAQLAQVAKRCRVSLGWLVSGEGGYTSTGTRTRDELAEDVQRAAEAELVKRRCPLDEVQRHLPDDALGVALDALAHQVAADAMQAIWRETARLRAARRPA